MNTNNKSVRKPQVESLAIEGLTLKASIDAPCLGVDGDFETLSVRVEGKDGGGYSIFVQRFSLDRNEVVVEKAPPSREGTPYFSCFYTVKDKCGKHVCSIQRYNHETFISSDTFYVHLKGAPAKRYIEALERYFPVTQLTWSAD